MMNLLLFVLMVSMLSGCVTALTLAQAHSSVEKRTLLDVKKAYVGTNDHLYLCVQSRDLEKKKEYWYEATLHTKEHRSSIQPHLLSARQCTDEIPFPIRHPVPLTNVHALSKANIQSIEDVATYLSERGDFPALYQVKLKPWREERLFFTDQQNNEQKIVTRNIDVLYQIEWKRESNPLWYILVPPAVVADVILSPLYLVGLIVFTYNLPSDADLH